MLAARSLAAALAGSGFVALVVVVNIVLSLQWVTGDLRLPPEFGTAVTNTWFAVLISVGAAWLLARAAGVRWLTLLATLILLPLPFVLAFQNVDPALIQFVMLGLSAVIGGAIILAGKPLRD